jgi:hypothetical protein
VGPPGVGDGPEGHVRESRNCRKAGTSSYEAIRRGHFFWAPAASHRSQARPDHAERESTRRGRAMVQQALGAHRAQFNYQVHQNGLSVSGRCPRAGGLARICRHHEYALSHQPGPAKPELHLVLHLPRGSAVGFGAGCGLVGRSVEAVAAVTAKRSRVRSVRQGRRGPCRGSAGARRCSAARPATTCEIRDDGETRRAGRGEDGGHLRPHDHGGCDPARDQHERNGGMAKRATVKAVVASHSRPNALREEKDDARLDTKGR